MSLKARLLFLFVAGVSLAGGLYLLSTPEQTIHPSLPPLKAGELEPPKNVLGPKRLYEHDGEITAYYDAEYLGLHALISVMKWQMQISEQDPMRAYGGSLEDLNQSLETFLFDVGYQVQNTDPETEESILTAKDPTDQHKGPELLFKEHWELHIQGGAPIVGRPGRYFGFSAWVVPKQPGPTSRLTFFLDETGVYRAERFSGSPATAASPAERVIMKPENRAPLPGAGVSSERPLETIPELETIIPPTVLPPTPEGNTP